MYIMAPMYKGNCTKYLACYRLRNLFSKHSAAILSVLFKITERNIFYGDFEIAVIISRAKVLNKMIVGALCLTAAFERALFAKVF